MKTLFLALSLMAATIMPSFAANEHESYGMAFSHCSIINKTAKMEIGPLAITAFVGGYLSAMNAFSAKKDVAHGRELDDIVAAFEKYCRKNPKAQGEDALLQVLIDIDTAYEDE